MTPKQGKRLYMTLAALSVLAGGALIANRMRGAVEFYYAPSEVTVDVRKGGRRVRVGGLVKQDSLMREGTRIAFVITDGNKELKVRYLGLLPPLFREGQGAIATGTFRDGVFYAESLLAKHDENYMPPEVAASLRKQGTLKVSKPSLEP